MSDIAKIASSKDFDGIMEAFCEQADCDVSKFKREASFAAQIINGNDKLMETDMNSRLQSVLNVAQIGLTLNPAAKEAYLIPRFVKGKILCQFMPSYIGLTKLLTDAGAIRNVYANVVYDGDEFDIEIGSEQKVTHRPHILSGKAKGNIKAVYSVAILPTGEKQIDYMDIAELHEIRERSETYKAFIANKIKSCTWVTDESEMMRKTMIRRIYKYLPKSNNATLNDRIEKAIELDQDASGFNSEASVNQISFIESLLRNANLDPDEKENIYNRLHSITEREAGKLIDMLQEKQLGISMTGVGGAKEINEHVKKVARE